MWRKTQVFLNNFGPDVEKACADGLSREQEIMIALKNWDREKSELLPCRLELILRQMAEKGHAVRLRTAGKPPSVAVGPECAPPWRKGKAFRALPPDLQKIIRDYEKDARKLSASEDAARHWSGVFRKRRRGA
jgi:hypothetical protein